MPHPRSLTTIAKHSNHLYSAQLLIAISSIRHGTESIDKRTCQTGIRNQRNIQVDGGTTDLVTVTPFAYVKFFGILTTMSISLRCSMSKCLRLSLLRWANRREYSPHRSRSGLMDLPWHKVYNLSSATYGLLPSISAFCLAYR